MNIGEASAASGVSAKMIRYYEETGLIPTIRRSDSGYRVYSDRDVQMLRFVRRARDLGFPVDQIADLLALWRDTSRHSSDVKHLATQRIEELHRKIDEMQEMVATLQTLADSCSGDARPDCPILANLAKDERPARSPRRTGLHALD
jgi:Cu(I)-responsive transcriptional regulator